MPSTRLRFLIGISFIFVIFISFITRLNIGINFPTGDLRFYLYGGQPQYNLFGVDKNILYSFLNISSYSEDKLYLLSFFQASLFCLASYLFFFTNLFKDKKKEIDITDLEIFIFFIISISSIFLMQLDMHLVRQQSAIYLFFISIALTSFRYKFLTFIVAIFFHEVALIFFAGIIFFNQFFNKSWFIYLILILFPIYYCINNGLLQVGSILALSFLIFIATNENEKNVRSLLFVSSSIAFFMSLLLSYSLFPPVSGERALLTSFVISFFTIFFIPSHAFRIEKDLRYLFHISKLFILFFYGVLFFAN